jgi:hypothetical protein
MAMRTRDFENATALAFLRVCRGLLKKVKCLDGRDEQDRLNALKLVERMIARFEGRVYL